MSCNRRGKVNNRQCDCWMNKRVRKQYCPDSCNPYYSIHLNRFCWKTNIQICNFFDRRLDAFIFILTFALSGCVLVFSNTEGTCWWTLIWSQCKLCQYSKQLITSLLAERCILIHRINIHKLRPEDISNNLKHVHKYYIIIYIHGCIACLNSNRFQYLM